MSNSVSQSSRACGEVVTDAAHPLFLEPTRKDVASSTSSWRYYCQQCNEKLINKDAFLNKHFENTHHEPVTICERCQGNVYEYCAKQSHATYHKCKKREEYVCSQNNNNNNNNNTHSVTNQKFPKNDKSNGKAI